MNEERPAHPQITWEDIDPDESAVGAFEILCEGWPPEVHPLVEEATGRAIESRVLLRPTHLFACDLGGERRILRVSQGYHLSYALRSYHAGLDHEKPTIRAECERVLRELRTTEGVLCEAEAGHYELTVERLRMLDEALRIEGRRLAELPFVLLLPQVGWGPAGACPEVVEIVQKVVELEHESFSEAALEASLQLPVHVHVPFYPRGRRGYLNGLATLARMIAAKRGLPLSSA